MSPRARHLIVCLISLSCGTAALYTGIHALPSATTVPSQPAAREAPLDLTQVEAPAPQSAQPPEQNSPPITVISAEDSAALIHMAEAAFSQPSTTATPSADPRAIRLRAQLHDAAALAKAAAQGDESAQEAVRERLANEPDPRIRAALTDGKIPPLGEDLPNAVQLPAASTAAEPGTYEGFWQYNNDACTSTITVDANGRATVDTIQHNPALGGDPPYHVRYDAWAWRDAAGNLVIDGRGQRVDDLLRPGQASPNWSPDSMTVTPTGLIDTIDDRRGTGLGSIGVSAIN